MRYILDGNAIAAKAFFGTHYKATEFMKARFTGAFLAMLEKLLQTIAGDPEAYIIFCVDSPSWRKKYTENYKGKDTSTKTELEKKLYFQYIETFNELTVDMKSSTPFYVVKKQGMEADDLLAYYTKYAFEGEKVVLVTSDKDMKQLVRKDSVLYYNFTEEKLEENLDPDYELHKLLCHGDSADNIPAINRDADGNVEFKFGEKTIEATYKRDQCNGMNISEEFLVLLSANKKWKISELTDRLKERYNKNRLLIDLYQAPWNKDGTRIKVTPKGSALTALDFWSYWGGNTSPWIASVFQRLSLNTRGEIG